MQRALLSAPSWVLPGASADLDFVHARAWAGGSTSLASLLSTSRASSGMAQFANGSWASFPANAPRITDQGLLIEQASTNSVRNNSMVGAVAGTPGTLPNDWNWGTGSLAPNVVGTGTENGLPYIDLQWSGTITGGITFLDFEGSQQIAAGQGQTWTASVFARLVAGSLANVTNIRLVTQSNNSSGAGLSGNLSSGAPSLLAMSTTAMTRYTSTYTLPDATAAFVLPYLRFDTAGAINFTIRIYAPQIEQLPFATSPIITGGSGAARAGDNIQAQGALLAAIRPSGMTLLAKAIFPTFPTPNATNEFQIVTIDDGTTSNRVTLFLPNGGSKGGAVATVGGTNQFVNQSAQPSASLTSGVPFKAAISYQASNYSFSINGSASTTQASGSVPTIVNKLWVGSRDGNAQFNSAIQRIVLQPPGQNVQSLTGSSW